MWVSTTSCASAMAFACWAYRELESSPQAPSTSATAAKTTRLLAGSHLDPRLPVVRCKRLGGKTYSQSRFSHCPMSAISSGHT